MAKQSPFLQRRGDSFGFRIAIPADLQTHFGRRELTRSLRTSDKRHALPLALLLGARIKRLFYDLRCAVTGSDHDKLKRLLEEARQKGALRERIEELEDALVEQRRQHLRELGQARLEARAEALEKVVAGAVSAPVPEHRPGKAVPKLGEVVQSFLDAYPSEKKSSMADKHRTVLPALLEVVGDKPVDEILQGDLNEFFDLIQKLPPKWKFEASRTGASIREIASRAHPVAMAEKTFDDTYKASVRAFLKAAKRNWGDRGFPVALTTDGSDYTGKREEGERRQRAFKPDELRLLFEGVEMRAISRDPEQSHRFWLPHVALFTGARVNEICQLNPHADIKQDDGGWHFIFTGDTEAAPEIRKRVKNATSRRKVPIHSKLIALGFLDYVRAVRAKGHKCLFPSWPPRNGRASANAEKWFKRHMEDIGLRDETPGARLTGMHAFRHTFLNRAMTLGVEGAEHITGHAGATDRVTRNYQGELSVERKREIVEKVIFETDHLLPVAPVITPPPAPRTPRKRA